MEKKDAHPEFAHHVLTLEDWKQRRQAPTTHHHCCCSCGVSSHTVREAYMHRATECPLRRVPCECGELVLAVEMHAHVSGKCLAVRRMNSPEVQAVREGAVRAAKQACTSANVACVITRAHIVVLTATNHTIRMADLSMEAIPPHERSKHAFAEFVSRPSTEFVSSHWCLRISQFHMGHCDHNVQKCTSCLWLQSVTAWHMRVAHENDALCTPCDFPLCDRHSIPCFWAACEKKIAFGDREYHTLMCPFADSICSSCSQAIVFNSRGTKRVKYASLGWIEKKRHTINCKQ